jgi:hypothetical protein
LERWNFIRKKENSITMDIGNVQLVFTLKRRFPITIFVQCVKNR